MIDCQRQDRVRVAPLVALDKRKAITLLRDRRLGWTIRGDAVFFDGLVGGKRQDKDAEHFGLIQDQIHGLGCRTAPGKGLFDLSR